MSTYNKDIKYIKGVGEKRAQLLRKKLGLFSLDALLSFYPRAYKDWSNPYRICDVPVDEPVCIRAKISSEIETKTAYNKKTVLYSFYIYDRTGQIKVLLFNTKYLAQSLEKDKEYLFYGKVKWSGIYRELSSPEIQPVELACIRPVYHATERLSSTILERIMREALRLTTDEETLPATVIEEHKLISRQQALQQIHFPASTEVLEKARRRLAFEELFLLRLGLLRLKDRNRGNSAKPMRPLSAENLQALFPFQLTVAQRRVIDECMQDMTGTVPMNRLVQGDVGSGKTAVAAALCCLAFKNGMGSVMLAPTEILAAQHVATLQKLFYDKQIPVLLLTGSLPAKEKRAVKERLITGEPLVLVTTHAVLSDDVQLPNTGLIITDEQHRFGVAQRAVLGKKANCPHTLVMSATPIPRTMALTVYGDLDISSIDELPAGRIPVESYFVGTRLRERALNYVKKHLDRGFQGYIVCPLIEESEAESANASLLAATEYAARLQQTTFAGYTVGLLHGKMKPKEKDEVMRRFVSGDIQLLVSTTVIEVGVDVPNAVIMVIENAERFGLSQLHQLRGRVGRGSEASTCILITPSTNEQTLDRLKNLCATTDGFKIAEADLKLRGPGNFLGQQQHGLPPLKIAEIATDTNLIAEVATAVNLLQLDDPALEKPENCCLTGAIDALFTTSDAVEFN